MTSFRPSALPRLRTLAVSFGLVAAALAARADIAVLREKGPHSGSAFSNPGLVANAPAGLKVAMKTADVKIHLRPGDGDTLKADCTAEFEMEDSSPAELNGQLYLVGFPVTGLSSKIVTIDQFKVTVDGKEPATIIRRAIGTHFMSMRVEDTPVTGTLESHIVDKQSPERWGIWYKGASGYRGSYLWQQELAPCKTLKVNIAYQITLHPQSIHYSKTFDSDEDGDAVIPFKTLTVDDWDDQYYFFDYVLRSGATWTGTIGKESITVTIDPSLGLHLIRIHPMAFRQSKELELREAKLEAENYVPGFNDIRNSDQWKTDDHAQSIRFTLSNEDPEFDLLIAIPLSAIKRKK